MTGLCCRQAQRAAHNSGGEDCTVHLPGLCDELAVQKNIRHGHGWAGYAGEQERAPAKARESVDELLTKVRPR